MTVKTETKFETLRDDADLRLWRRAGETDRLILCFSSVGSDPGLPPPPEWRRQMARRSPSDNLLFLADPRRSWLNRPGLIEEMNAAIEAEVARSKAARICAIGVSLGAFSAMVMSGFTKIDAVIAHSPQYSMDPSYVPDEVRWSNYTREIKHFRILGVADHLHSGSQYFVFLSAHPREMVQGRLIDARPNLDLYLMPADCYHITQHRMRQAGVLDQITAACFDLKRDHLQKIMHQAFACQRQPVPKA